MQERWDEEVGALTRSNAARPPAPPPAAHSVAAVMRACILRGNAESAVAVFRAAEPVHDHRVLLIAVAAFLMHGGDWQSASHVMIRQLSLPLASTDPEPIAAILERFMDVVLGASTAACERDDSSAQRIVAASTRAVQLSGFREIARSGGGVMHKRMQQSCRNPLNKSPLPHSPALACAALVCWLLTVPQLTLPHLFRCLRRWNALCTRSACCSPPLRTRCCASQPTLAMQTSFYAYCACVCATK